MQRLGALIGIHEEDGVIPVILFVAFAFFAAPALAQSAYVAGAVGVDVSRFDTVEAAGVPDLTAGGEAAALSLRLGTAIGQRWGVELAFTRPSEVEREGRQGYPIPLAVISAPTQAGVAVPPGVVFPVFESRIRSQRRNTTLDAVAWVAQGAGSRVDLVYLAGIAFTRIVEDVDFEFTRHAIGIVLPGSTRTIVYGVAPVAGIEARVSLTDHVMLVPGMRLYGIGGNAGRGWLLRAATGLAWRF